MSQPHFLPSPSPFYSESSFHFKVKFFLPSMRFYMTHETCDTWLGLHDYSTQNFTLEISYGGLHPEGIECKKKSTVRSIFHLK